jgi:transposase
MKYQEVVGIDVSKKTLDAHLHIANDHHQFENSHQGIAQLCRWCAKQSSTELDEHLFVFEHTGIYSYTLCVDLQQRHFAFALVPGLEIKKSQGMQRGKSDKADAKMIARYGFQNQDKLRLYELPAMSLQRLKKLLNLRERMVSQRAGYISSLNEAKSFYRKKDFPRYFASQQSMIKSLDKQIDLLEKEIDQVVESDEKLRNTQLLLTSITGVGKVTSITMIALTNCFTQFSTWRKFACYAGTAPFPNQSGISLKGKTKVSPMANKRIKALLDCGARAAINHDPEIRLYYQRRLEEGKTKKSSINVVRNKLISRMFAVVKRATPYVNTNNFAS